MMLLRILAGSWLIFILVQETISLREVLLLKEAYGTPLALIRNRDSSLQLTIPHYNAEHDEYAAYSSNDPEDEDDPKGKIVIACPTSDDDEKQLNAEKNWMSHGITSSESRLFFVTENTGPDVQCSGKVIPTIKKVAEENTEDPIVKHCSQSQAEMYEVGYPVSNDDEGKDVQFIPIYRICYSQVTSKAVTLYSIHRIQSPSLLFMNVMMELPPDDKPLSSNSLYQSVLDISLSTQKYFEGMVYYKHQFVGKDDMSSIRPWEQTTYFLFNYTPITINEDLYKGIIRAEWYIRLLSKRKNMPLTLYSGTHQHHIGTGVIQWVQKQVRQAKPVDSFWRIISDDRDYAIILVIQHNLRRCGPVYLCKTTLQVKTYQNGGCIYTCSLKDNGDLFELLGVPRLEIKGDLDFTIQLDPVSLMGFGEFRPSYNIIDFLSKETLLEALTSIDANILRKGGLVEA